MQSRQEDCMLRAHRRGSQRWMESCGRAASAAHERRGTMTCGARRGSVLLNIDSGLGGNGCGRASEISPGSQ